MFLHTHPYEPIFFEDATRWIVGTLPPPRFTTGELRAGDVDFCYGSRDGQLWPILERVFGCRLQYGDGAAAVQQRLDLLRSQKIGICDVVARARREKIDASDAGMKEVELRDLISYLRQYPKVHTLLFTGGNSKNGPEYFFRRILRRYGIPLQQICTDIPRIHEFLMPEENSKGKGEEPRRIRTVSLIAPSGSANRAVGGLEEYKRMKQQFPDLTTIDFRVRQYSRFFRDIAQEQ